MNADPYDEFLAAADVATWRRCLDRLEAATDMPDGEFDVDRLAQALCVAVYLKWLAELSGDTEAEIETGTRCDSLVARLTARAAVVDGHGLRRCWALVLADAGYRHRGFALLAAEGEVAVEHLLLVTRPGEAGLRTRLRAAFAGHDRPGFLPALHRYAGELADAGRISEARAVITSGGWPDTEPFVVDILGFTSEQLGRWEEAHQAYRASPWPAHRYRAAITGAILGGERPDLELDEPVRRLLNGSDDEIGQREMPQRIALVNACLWRAVDDWVVHRELGEMGFRRRRFAEADFDLARAERLAPDAARFPIADLRFVNLTWLTGGSAVGTSMAPEAVSAARKALAVSTAADKTEKVRNWLLWATGEINLIPDDRRDWIPYRRGEAAEFIGDAAGAFEAYLESLRSTQTVLFHRAVVHIIRRLAAAGFVQTTTYLARLVLEECFDDFFALWETASALFGVADRTGIDSYPDDELAQVEEEYWERMRELSRLEFKNGMRLIGLAAENGLRDLVEELFGYVARQAEGVSELLAVAVQRRHLTGLPTNQVLHEVLRCLMRAREEARNRLERLQIARELFHCGQPGEAHAILAAERVTAPETLMSHAEMSVLLQCGAWLTSAEREALAGRARHQIDLDESAGKLGPDAHLYRARLNEALDEAGVRLLSSEESRSSPRNPTKDGLDSWPVGAKRWPLVELDKEIGSDRNLGAFVRKSFGPDSSLGIRLMFCLRLRNLLDGRLEAARAFPPAGQGDEIPVEYAADDDELVIQFCDAWRARLSPTSQDVELLDGRLRNLQATERARAERWRVARRRQDEPMWYAVAQAGEALLIALEGLVGPTEKAERHPVLADIHAKMEEDVATLSRDLAEQVRLARSLAAGSGASA